MLADRYGFDGVAEVILQSGMRAAIGKIIMDKPSYAATEFTMYPGMVEDAETSIGHTLQAYDKWEGAGDGRIQVWFGPRTPGGVTPSLYDEIEQTGARTQHGHHHSSFRSEGRPGLCPDHRAAARRLNLG